MERLKILRKIAGITQSELANRVNRSLITVFRWEKGERNPDLEEIKLLAGALNCPVSALFDDFENPTSAPGQPRRAPGASTPSAV